MLLTLQQNMLLGAPLVSPTVQHVHSVALAMPEFLVEAAMPERSVSLNVPEIVVLLET